MGLEARCEIRWQGYTWQASVHLDSKVLEVRGRPRLVFPLASIRAIHPAAGELELATDDGRLTLVLGAAVAAWARKVRAPPSRLTKLGIVAKQRVCLLGLEDVAFRAELAAAGARLIAARGKADSIFLGATTPADLERLAPLRERIAPDGAIWVVRVKGKAASVKENEVREAARAAGLVDVKVAAFSETHTAEKLVIPVAERAGGTPAERRAVAPAGHGKKPRGSSATGSAATGSSAKKRAKTPR
jgi:hypothetical protein